MLKDRVSKLKSYSLGIVVKNKAKGDDRIMVCPIEDLTFIEGLLAEYTQDFNVSLPDINGKINGVKLLGDGHVVAKWIPYGSSNRISPPDVRAGETVQIFQYADNDEYHWTTIFNEPSLRRLECATYMYSDLANGSKPYDKASSYWFEVSTADKTIKLHTSKSNGETVGYDVVLDTGTATLLVTDDVGNSVHLESNQGRLSTVTTKEINATTETVNIKAAMAVNITGDQQVNITTKAAHVVAETLVADVTKTADINAATINLKGTAGDNLKGIVNGSTICPFSGKPHVDVSTVIFSNK